MSKEHCVTVSIVSTSGGVVNQEITLREYASTPEELVAKNFALAEAVAAACFDSTRKLAAPYLRG